MSFFKFYILRRPQKCEKNYLFHSTLFMFGSLHFGIFVFPYFGHFSCVILFMFFFCLAHLSLQNVNKDYIIFSYFHNFVAKSDQKPKMGWTKHMRVFRNIYYSLQSKNSIPCGPSIMDYPVSLKQKSLVWFIWTRVAWTHFQFQAQCGAVAEGMQHSNKARPQQCTVVRLPVFRPVESL